MIEKGLIMNKKDQKKIYRETRLRRANVWLDLAQNDADDVSSKDVKKFVFYWIAFEAMFTSSSSEKQPKNWTAIKFMEKFIGLIVTHYGNPKDLTNILLDCGKHIEAIHELRTTDSTFWEKTKKFKTEKEWLDHHNQQKTKAGNRLKHIHALSIKCKDGDWYKMRPHLKAAYLKLFARLRVVRNQIFHGASSGDESFGRPQVQAAVGILEKIIPEFARVIASHPDEDWKIPSFPRLGFGKTPNELPSPFWAGKTLF